MACELAIVLVEDGDEHIVALEANVFGSLSFDGDTKKTASFDFYHVTKIQGKPQSIESRAQIGTGGWHTYQQLSTLYCRQNIQRRNIVTTLQSFQPFWQMKLGFWWDVELFGHNFTIFFDKIEIAKSFDGSVVVEGESLTSKQLDIFGYLQGL